MSLAGPSQSRRTPPQIGPCPRDSSPVPPHTGPMLIDVARVPLFPPLARPARLLLTAGLGLVLCGCAVAPKSTGVVDLGDNTFRVTARGTMGVPAQSRKVALTQADEFCAARNQAMQVTETGKAPLAGPFEVTFTCLPDTNPEATTNAVKKPGSAVQPVK